MRSNICPKAGGDEAGTTQISVGRNPDKGKANAKVPRPLWPKGMGGGGELEMLELIEGEG